MQFSESDVIVNVFIHLKIKLAVNLNRRFCTHMIIDMLSECAGHNVKDGEGSNSRVFSAGRHVYVVLVS